MDDRIKRISERLNVPENKAKDIIKKKDKEVIDSNGNVIISENVYGME